jgi:hypothetical protein
VSENLQIILGILALIAVYVLTRKVNAWRIGRAYRKIIRDLEQREAFDPASASYLPYARQSILRAGMKDFRPKALEYLVLSDIVGKTEAGFYYLKKRDRKSKDTGPF